MSHTVKIQTQFRTENLDSFRRALEHFGWKLKEQVNMRTYDASTRNTSYPLVAVNPANGYDIGIKFNEESGEIELYGDFYDGSIAKSLGKNLNNLKQEYGCCVIEDKLAYAGYTATRHELQDGVIDITAE